MFKQNNYDTKQSIFSIDYKIPYEGSQSQRIVEHLEESQCELQFLKEKLTSTYSKLEQQMKNNMELSDQRDNYEHKMNTFYQKWVLEQKQNAKLKQVMEKVIKNRRLLEQELQYTHKRYKKILSQKQETYESQLQEYQRKMSQYERKIRLIEHQNKLLNDTIQKNQEKQKDNHHQQLEQKIDILEAEIRKITNEKVAEVTRLKHQIQCYQKSTSPFRNYDFSASESGRTTMRPSRKKNKVQNFIEDDQYFENNQNVNINILPKSLIKPIHQDIVESKIQQSVGKWKKSNASSVVREDERQLTEDQKLTNCQIQKKRFENQLLKMERLKRPNQSDRQLIEGLEKKIYNLDSQISCLKRKIRQKY